MAITTRLNDMGCLEGFNEETGVVEWVEKKRRNSSGKPVRRDGAKTGGRRWSGQETHHYVLDGDGKKQWVPKGLNPNHLPCTIWPFNETTVQLVLAKVMAGHTVVQIGKMEGMPPAHTITKWTFQYPEFKKQMKQARAARADYFHDKAIETAEAAQHEEDVPVARLQVDTYKWAAKVGDPDTFGEKVKHSGDPDAPLGFIIATGVPTQEEQEIESEVSPSSLITTKSEGHS